MVEKSETELYLKTDPKKKLGHCEAKLRMPLLKPKICPVFSTVK